MSKDLALSSYPSLRREILQLLEQGKERARLAVEREKVRTYWEIGRVLSAHLLANKERAGYGDQILARLAADLEVHERRLYEALQLHQYFPILLTSAELTLSHYKALLPLPLRVERDYYAKEAGRNNWSVRELRSRIKAGAFRRALEEPKQPAGALTRHPLNPLRGRLYTYRLIRPAVEAWPELRVDQGLEKYGSVELSIPTQADHGTVVESIRDGRCRAGYRLAKSTATRRACYVYPAAVERVVDGDTLWVWLDLGFGDLARQNLRLRGIDAPEMNTSEGRSCRSYVVDCIAGCDRIVVSTSRPDKFGRYLADLFYLPGETDAEMIRAKGTFLNQQLLDEGLAKRYTA
jgi:endonuclease YncB( thermonuclease family)